MLKKILLGTIAFGLLIISLSFIPLGKDDPHPEMEIYLLSNEIHTGIVIPVKNDVFDWETFINKEDYLDRPSEWIEMGWGDRQFYFEMPTLDKLTFKLAFDALFLPDPAIVHVNYLDAHPREYASHKVLKISKVTYKKLVEEMIKRFELQNGKPILIPNKGYTSTDNFYESYGSFSVLRTCNIWTAEILGEADLKRPVWSPTKYGLEFLYQSIGK